ncbi:MAG TPA: hypothetical protein VLJ62_12345 [Burkholderiaceae bacterium]|nr:hypothetical protein [Burkholderiaceae bacterium]
MTFAATKPVQMLHVPFRDFGQLYTAVATKEVDWALGSIASAGAMERGPHPVHRAGGAVARPAVSGRAGHGGIGQHARL